MDPTGPSLRKPASAKAVLNQQHPFSTAPFAIRIFFPASAAPLNFAPYILQGLQSLKSHGFPLRSRSQFPETDFVDARLSGKGQQAMRC